VPICDLPHGQKETLEAGATIALTEEEATQPIAAGRREAVRCWTLQKNTRRLDCDVMCELVFFIRMCVTVDAVYTT
jgi:hypothetical protein